MVAGFDKMAQTVRLWERREGLSPFQVTVAETAWRMADRLAHNPERDMAAEKCLKVIGCYLCRRMGEAVCMSPLEPRCALDYPTHTSPN